jgi:tryptophan-rich sensory protein
MKHFFSKHPVLTTMGAIVLINILGIIAGLSSAENISTWYPTLSKPALQPPNWIFGPVWSALYTMLGVILARLLRAYEHHRCALTLFVLQMLLNLAWTPVFFGLKQIGVALVIIISLWLVLFGLLKKLCCRDRVSAYLLLPYVIWVTFAMYLNLGIFWLN